MLNKVLSNIHRPLIMWLVIVSVSIVAVGKYGLPAVGKLLYRWENCMSDEVLAKNEIIKFKLGELFWVERRQQRLFEQAFHSTVDGTFNNKKTLLAQHKKMMRLRAEVPDLLREKDPDEWSVPYNEIEEMIEKFIADDKMHDQLFEKSINSISEDLGKSIEELNSTTKIYDFHWQDYIRAFSEGGYQKDYEMTTLYRLYAKEDCRKSS